MSPSWSEPVAAQGSAHDFRAEPVLEANYQRTDTVDAPDRFSDVPGAMRSQTIHRFIRDGVMVDVWGSADLDGKLRGIPSGTLCRIVYDGLEDIGEGKQIKRFTVQYDTSGAGQAQVTHAADDDIPF